MEILEAYDLTGSYRKAAELAGCDHHTVAHYVALRGQGVDPTARKPRAKMIDTYLPKIEELVERSKGKIGADVVHRKLTALGFTGTDRTTRRAVAAAKHAWRSGNRRVYRPWIPEPGMWLQYDYGEGPKVDGQRTHLWCAWLAWSRFRVVFPIWDKTLPTVAACLDRTFRIIGGVPTYVLTDNEKTVTLDHVAGIPVRHPTMAQVGRFYGTTVRTCLPADPESKGGSENTVKIAKRDLVPTAVNLRAQYGAFSALEEACEAWSEEVNFRVHTATQRVPAEALMEEQTRLHLVPEEPFSAAFGETRRVRRDATVTLNRVVYSVPHQLTDQTVWVRHDGDEVVIVAASEAGAREVARHTRSTPGQPSINDDHYPPSTRGNRRPKPGNKIESQFLALGHEAEEWLIAAAAAGASRISQTMTRALEAVCDHGRPAVIRALATACTAERFDTASFDDILAYQQYRARAEVTRASEDHSLQPGTGAWASFGPN